MKSGSALIAFALITVLSTSVPAVDSPWPKFRHDLRNTGQTPYTGPASPTVHWTFPTDDGIASSPSIGEDGTIYVGSGWHFTAAVDSHLYAINPDGSLKWRFKTGAGIFSSPCVGPDGVIYFGSHDRRIYAVEDSVTYGKFKWSILLNLWVHSSPCVGPDGTVYVGSLDWNFCAIDPAGFLKWRYRADWCVFSSPAIGPEGEIYVGSKDHHLYAFEDSVTYGKVRWAHPTGTFYDGHLVDSSPAIGPNGTLYVGTDPYGAAGQDPVPVDTVFWAINPDGSLKWTFVMGDGAESSPAIGPDGTIYVGSYDGNVYAIRDEGTHGQQLWAFPTGGVVDASPTVDGCGTIYIGSRDSTMYALNPDGSLKWSFKTGGDIESSVAVDKNGIIYFGSFDGNLYALGSVGPDVGAVSINLPDEVNAGSVVIPRARVRNYRVGAESFNVACLIDTSDQVVYGDTLFITDLAETTSVLAMFSPWSVSPDTGIVYNVTVTTLLGGDNNTYNDTVTAQIPAVADLPSGNEGGQAPPFALSQSYPNPFSSTTTIQFSIEKRTQVGLKVYNIAGQLVRTLVNEELSPGVYSDVIWDGRDNNGRPVSSGIYFYRLVTRDFVETKKMVLLK